MNPAFKKKPPVVPVLTPSPIKTLRVILTDGKETRTTAFKGNRAERRAFIREQKLREVKHGTR